MGILNGIIKIEKIFAFYNHSVGHQHLLSLDKKTIHSEITKAQKRLDEMDKSDHIDFDDASKLAGWEDAEEV